MAQRDLLCCNLGASHVAFPLERVIGVAEGLLVTPPPYSAPSFEGFVEVFGQVMPQVDVAALLAQPAAAGGMLVVVSDRGGSLALRVVSVTGMIQVEGENLAPTAARSRAAHPLYMADFEHQGVLHHVLDLDLLATSDGLELSLPEGAVLLPEARSEARPEPEQEWLPLLLLDIAGERYAIPNRSIIELNVPEGIRSAPGTPDWILGLIDVRGQPIVAVSTATLLGQPTADGQQPPNVCLIAELEDGLPIALFVDRVIGLERVSPTLIHPMPQAMAGISGYFVLHGDQIVGLIDPKQLLAQVAPWLRAAIPQQPTATLGASDASELGQYQQLLSLRVGRELYAMTLDRIDRIQASVRLTPLPSDIAYFDGMADVGDAIVPVIDLRRQQGAELQPFDSTERPPCILTVLDGAMTGILVDQVLSIIDIPPERFEPVIEASRLPISHVVAFEGQLIALLTIDRLLPPSTKMSA